MIKYAKGCTGQLELDEVKEALEYGYFGHAYKVEAFEKGLNSYIGGGHTVAVCNGTAAIHLGLEIANVRGGEVLLPSFTFAATVQAVLMAGGKPVFCEVDEGTLCLDIDDVIRKSNPNTKAVIPVHYSGNPCEMDALLNLKEIKGLRIVEDAAHAFGSTYQGKRIGSFGDITCFSFDSIKVLTCGEGGAVTVRSEEEEELLKKLRLLGIDRKTHASADWKSRAFVFDISTQGFRYHMSNINAAIGLVQLDQIERFIAKRRMLCEIYESRFAGKDFIRRMPYSYGDIAPFMYVIRVDGEQRDSLRDHLKSCDIETAISYVPNHVHSYFQFGQGSLPVTDRVFSEIITLPLHFDLSEEDVQYVADCTLNFFCKQ